MFDSSSPILLAVVAALLFALGAQFQNIGLAAVDSRSGARISITASALTLWLMAPFLLDLTHFGNQALWIFVAVGLFRPSVSANLAVAGMRYLGPTLSTTLSSTSPLFGAAFGILWLGEELTWSVGLGTLVIMAAVIVVAKRDKKIKTSWPVWALGLPVGAAAVRSLGHVFSKIGMEDIPDPYFASVVSMTVSAVVMNLASRYRPSVDGVPWRRREPYAFALAGAIMAIALMALNSALLQAPIVSVVPIVACSPIFTMLLSILIFRREKLTPRVVAAVFMVVPAVIAIAVNF